MTIRQFVNRSIIRTLLLTALLPLATANAAQTADGFWGHRIGLRSMSPTEGPPKFSTSTYMANALANLTILQ